MRPDDGTAAFTTAREVILARARSILQARQVPTEAEMQSLRAANWGRWGQTDERGAINLIGQTTRLQALGQVATGLPLSLSRPIPTNASSTDRNVAHRVIFRRDANGRTAYGSLHESLQIQFHGTAFTHIDSLSHVWEGDRFWNGRPVSADTSADDPAWGGISAWSDGIITRGVLFDVPAHRGTQYVTPDRPVHGWELQDIARDNGIQIAPGDGLVVYAGRDAWEREHGPYRVPDRAAQAADKPKTSARPGLHPSCLAFLCLSDASILVWDMLDMRPSEFSNALTVHCAIPWFGMALVDNASLNRLVDECQRRGRLTFALLLAPLNVMGSTGSVINPVAIL